MKLTTLFRLRKPDGTDPVNIEDFNDNFDVIDEELGKRLESTGAASDMTVAFEQASARTNLKTGEKISVSFGKIMKWFADLKTVAFSGSYNDLTSKPTIPSGAAASQAVANNCTTTAAGSVLDARQGKVLMDKANQLSSEMASMKTSFQAGVDTLYNKCSSCGATPSAKTPTAISTAIQKIYTDRYNAGLSAATLSKCEVLATASNQDQTSLSHTTSKAYKLVICCVGAGDQGKSLNGGHATASCAGFNAAVSKQFDDVQIGSTKVAFGSHVFYLFNVPSGKKINLNWSYRGIGTIIGFN